jgi:outer membrane protein with glycine zipper
LLRNKSAPARLISSSGTPKFIRMNSPILVSGISLSCLFLTSCDTPVGQGAAWGAATGAIIGGAATGNVRAASIGAAAGAAAGALTGAAIQQDQVARYGPPAPGGYPYARWAGTPGLYYSPYTGRVYNLQGVPPGGLTRDVDTGRLFRKP